MCLSASPWIQSSHFWRHWPPLAASALLWVLDSPLLSWFSVHSVPIIIFWSLVLTYLLLCVMPPMVWPTCDKPISDLLSLVMRLPCKEISVETKTKRKQRLCSAVSLGWAIFYVHLGASDVSHPQVSLCCRQVTPLVSKKQGLECSWVQIYSHGILIIRE